MNRLFVTLACLTFLALGASCAGDVGDSCDKPGDASQCVDTAMCTQIASGTKCLKRCLSDADCAPTEACNGVTSTNIKTCQPK